MKVFAKLLVILMLGQVNLSIQEWLGKETQVEVAGFNVDDVSKILTDGLFAKSSQANVELISDKIKDLIEKNKINDPKRFINFCENSIKNIVGCQRSSFESKNLNRLFLACMESAIKYKPTSNVEETFQQLLDLDDLYLLAESLFKLNRMNNPAAILKSLKDSKDIYESLSSKSLSKFLQKLYSALRRNKVKNPSRIVDAISKSIKDLFGKNLSSTPDNTLLSLVDDLLKLLKSKNPVQAIENLTNSIKKLVNGSKVPLDHEELISIVKKAIDSMVKNDSDSISDELLTSLLSKNDDKPRRNEPVECKNLLNYLIEDRAFKQSDLSNTFLEKCNELLKNQNATILEKFKNVFTMMLNPILAKRSTTKIEVLFSLANSIFDLLILDNPNEYLNSLSQAKNYLREMSPESIIQFLNKFFNNMKKNKLSNPSEFINRINTLLSSLLGSNLLGINEKTLLDILSELLRLIDLPNRFDGLLNIDKILKNVIGLENDRLDSIIPDNLFSILKVLVNEILKNRSTEKILPRLQNSNELKKLLNNIGLAFKLTSTTTTTTTTIKPLAFPILQKNYPIKSLLESGFKKVYENFYSDILYSSFYDSFRAQCNSDSILCAGGGQTGSDVLILVSCANCYSVLTQTELREPKNIGSAWWYFNKNSPLGKCFGFAPSPSLNQEYCDVETNQGDLRLCWYVDLAHGGYRVGTAVALHHSNDYRKYIFIR